MLGRIGSGTFSEVFTVSLRVSTQHRVYKGNHQRPRKHTKYTNGVDTARFRDRYEE